MKYRISYFGFLQNITRRFKTLESAEYWCRAIGRPDLIANIETI